MDWTGLESTPGISGRKRCELSSRAKNSPGLETSTPQRNGRWSQERKGSHPGNRNLSCLRLPWNRFYPCLSVHKQSSNRDNRLIHEILMVMHFIRRSLLEMIALQILKWIRNLSMLPLNNYEEWSIAKTIWLKHTTTADVHLHREVSDICTYWSLPPLH
jgi:hypothetical protein